MAQSNCRPRHTHLMRCLRCVNYCKQTQAALSLVDWQLSLNWPKINGQASSERERSVRELWSFGQLAIRATTASAAAI